MKKGNKFFLKVFGIFDLSLFLGILAIHIDKVSNYRDFLAGLLMGILIVILLELVYSVIRSLQENSDNKTGGQ